MPDAANLAPQTDNSDLSARFLGSWTLVSVEQTLPSGEVLKPFGDDPSGLILYAAGGHMSAQLGNGNPKRFASDDFMAASDGEAAAAWRMYISYWGTFKIDAGRRVIVHKVEGSLFSNWIGTEQVRHFSFDDANLLTLEAESPSGRSTLTWRRM
jgi:hypothetical protein